MSTALFLPRQPWRMPASLLVSLAVHGLLLTVVLGGQAFGLPGLALPWKERRLGADDLQIVLAPAPAPVPAPVPDVPGAAIAPTPAPVGPARATVAPVAIPAMTALAPPAVSAPDLPASPPPEAPDVATQARAVELARVARAEEDALRVRATELLASARRDAAQQAERQIETARVEAAARLEAGRAEALHQEAARRAALAQQQAREEELARQAAASQDAAQQELARQEQAKQEQARQQARQDQAKQEQQERARQEQARQEQARQEQARQEQARQEQSRQEQARQDQARQEQARQDLAQRERAEQEAQRAERLRAIGRQLNAEAAQRDAAADPSRSLLPGASSLRRGWLLGRADANVQLVEYAEAMGRKFELNMTFDMVRDLVKQPHVDPVVTMAIRADGTVEKVTFDVPSGVPAIDAAIRRVIASQAPYGAFPPALARQYDVVEIRRTWKFDTAIRLQ